jgi:hypothetical protein
LVTIFTEPNFAAFKAKESPAIPLPITRKSLLFVTRNPLLDLVLSKTGIWQGLKTTQRQHYQ